MVVLVLYPIVFIIVVASQLAISDGEPIVAVITMLAIGAFPLGFWLGALRPFIRAEDSALIVRNPFSTTRIAYAEIVGCRPGYTGIAIRTRSGRVVAWAVQKSNIASWLHRNTRADEVAAFIMDRSRPPADGA